MVGDPLDRPRPASDPGCTQRRSPDPPDDDGDDGDDLPDGGGGDDDESASAGTSELRSLLRRKAQAYDRPKSSIGSVRIEEFHGDRRRYQRWKRSVEAQERLYRLEQGELAMLVYLSTRSEARDVVDQLPLSDYIAPGGALVLWKLLDESFGESTSELFERAEKELANYRRMPGQSIATFLAGMKRLRAQYLRVDPDSTISEKAWSQKLLAKASISRRERLDVFYSAGGTYNAVAIEAALRHRCAAVHEDERKLPQGAREGFSGGSSTTRSFRTSRPSSSSASATSSGKSSRMSFRRNHAHVADEGELEDEDLEQEFPNAIEEEEEADELDVVEEEEQNEGEETEEEGLTSLTDMREAFAAGWKAKAKVAGQKKARGWSRTGSSTSSSTASSLQNKKRISACASCGERGHWRGDPVCKSVKNGKDALHVPKRGHASHEEPSVNYTNFTFVSGGIMPPGCPQCGVFVSVTNKFCPECGQQLSQKRTPWTLVGSKDRAVDSEGGHWRTIHRVSRCSGQSQRAALWC